MSDWTGVWELHPARRGRRQHARPQRCGARRRRGHGDVEHALSRQARRLRCAPAASPSRARRRGRAPRAARQGRARPVRRSLRTADVARERTRHAHAGEPRRGARGRARVDRAAHERTIASAPALPLRKDLRTLAVIGPLADDSSVGIGHWGGAGRREDAVRVLAGIRRAVPRGTTRASRGRERRRASDTRGSPRRCALARARGRRGARRSARRGDMSGEATSRASLELPGSQLAARASALARDGEAGGRRADERPSAGDRSRLADSTIRRLSRAGSSASKHGNAHRRRAVRRRRSRREAAGDDSRASRGRCRSTTTTRTPVARRSRPRSTRRSTSTCRGRRSIPSGTG